MLSLEVLINEFYFLIYQEWNAPVRKTPPGRMNDKVYWILCSFWRRCPCFR